MQVKDKLSPGSSLQAVVVSQGQASVASEAQRIQAKVSVGSYFNRPNIVIVRPDSMEGDHQGEWLGNIHTYHTATTSDCFRLLPIASYCFRLLPIASDCFRLLPNTTGAGGSCRDTLVNSLGDDPHSRCLLPVLSSAAYNPSKLPPSPAVSRCLPMSTTHLS